MLQILVLVLSVVGCEPVHYSPAPTPVYYDHGPTYQPVTVPIYQPMPDRYVERRKVVVQPTIVVQKKTTVIKTKTVQKPTRKTYTFKSRRK